MCNVNKNKNQGPKVQKALSPCRKKSKLSWIGRFFFFFFFSFRKQRCTVEQSEIPKQNNKKERKEKKTKQKQVRLDKGLKINLDVVTTLGARCARYKIKVLLFSAGKGCFSSMNKFQKSDPKLEGQQSWVQFMQQFCWIQTDLSLWMALADNYTLWTAVVDSLVLLLAVETSDCLCKLQLLTAWCCYMHCAVETSDCLCELQLLTAWCCYMQWKPVTVFVNSSCWQFGAATGSGNQWVSLWTAVVDSLVLLQAVETSDCLWTAVVDSLVLLHAVETSDYFWTAVVDSLVLLLAVETSEYFWTAVDDSLVLLLAVETSEYLWTAVVDSLVLLLAVETSDCLCELQLLTAQCCYMHCAVETSDCLCELQLLSAWCCYLQ